MLVVRQPGQGYGNCTDRRLDRDTNMLSGVSSAVSRGGPRATPPEADSTAPVVDRRSEYAARVGALGSGPLSAAELRDTPSAVVVVRPVGFATVRTPHRRFVVADGGARGVVAGALVGSLTRRTRRSLAPVQHQPQVEQGHQGERPENPGLVVHVTGGTVRGHKTVVGDRRSPDGAAPGGDGTSTAGMGSIRPPTTR